MRILHVIGSLDPSVGGPAVAALELCRELARCGEQVSLYTTNARFAGNGRIGRSKVATNTPVNIDGVEVSYFSFAGPKLYPWSRPMWRALRDNVAKFDVVHIHSLYLFHSAAAAFFCRRYRVPFVIRPHGTLDPYLRQRHRLRHWLYESLVERQSLAAAAAIHFTATEEMDLALRCGPLDKLRVASRCHMIPNGIVLPGPLAQQSDAAQRQALLQRFPELRGRRLVLFLGRINLVKGLEILTQAFARLCRQRTDAHLVIAGPDNEGRGRLVRQWLEAEGILDRTTFTGMLVGAEKRAAFDLAATFVLPSYSENFAIAAVEAMAHGLAVIISNRVKIWREVADARAGIVINCDPAELAAAIAHILEDDQARREMGERGRQLAVTRFTWPIVTAQVLDLYRSITPAPRPPLGSHLVSQPRS